MSSRTEISNLALSHLGVSKDINNVDTERSSEASACRRFLDHVISEFSRDFNYPFLTTIASLSLVEEEPNDEWNYSYRYPSDCSRMKRILSGVRNDSRQSRVPYKIIKDSIGKLILTDQENAEAEYTTYLVDVENLSADSVSAVSLLLASYIAPRVTAGDPFKLGERAYSFYVVSKAKSEANALNEEQKEEEVDSEFIRDRE